MRFRIVVDLHHLSIFPLYADTVYICIRSLSTELFELLLLGCYYFRGLYFIVKIQYICICVIGGVTGNVPVQVLLLFFGLPWGSSF